MTCCIHVFTTDTPVPEARTTEVPVVTEQLAALSTDADDVIIVVMPILVVITLCVASLWLLCWRRRRRRSARVEDDSAADVTPSVTSVAGSGDDNTSTAPLVDVTSASSLLAGNHVI